MCINPALEHWMWWRGRRQVRESGMLRDLGFIPNLGFIYEGQKYYLGPALTKQLGEQGVGRADETVASGELEWGPCGRNRGNCGDTPEKELQNSVTNSTLEPRGKRESEEGTSVGQKDDEDNRKKKGSQDEECTWGSQEEYEMSWWVFNTIAFELPGRDLLTVACGAFATLVLSSRERSELEIWNRASST